MPFKEKEQQLLQCCLACPPDMDGICRMLAEEVNVNACDGDDTLLSEVIAGFGRHEQTTGQPCNGKALADIVRLFLQRGFDVRGQNGRTGAVCLVMLMFALYDDAMLSIADMLLEAGADPCYLFEDDGETLLEAVRFEAVFLMGEGFEQEAGYVERLYEKLKAAAET